MKNNIKGSYRPAECKGDVTITTTTTTTRLTSKNSANVLGGKYLWNSFSIISLICLFIF